MAKDKNTHPASEQEKDMQAITAQENETPPEHAEVPADPALKSLDILADLHRVPGWQQAGLSRLMGWQPDKHVSNADYLAALESLKNRRIGGGRMDLAELADTGDTEGATHRAEGKE